MGILFVYTIEISTHGHISSLVGYVSSRTWHPTCYVVGIDLKNCARPSVRPSVRPFIHFFSSSSFLHFITTQQQRETTDYTTATTNKFPLMCCCYFWISDSSTVQKYIIIELCILCIIYCKNNAYYMFYIFKNIYLLNKFNFNDIDRKRNHKIFMASTHHRNETRTTKR